MSTLRTIPGFLLLLGVLGGCAVSEDSTPAPAAPAADDDVVAAAVLADDPAEDRSALQVACEVAAQGIDACLSENPSASCQPEDAGLALTCCNALGPDALATCASACVADAVEEPSDLSFLREHFGEALVHAETYVVPTCGGIGFEDVVAAHHGASPALLAHGVDSWGEGREGDVLDGMMLQSVEEVLPGLHELGRDDSIEAWTFGVEVAGDTAMHHFSKWVLFFPRTGVVVVLEGEVAFV